MRFVARRMLVLALVLTPVVALAQTPPAGTGGATPAPAPAPAQGGGTAPAATGGGGAAPSASAKPVVPAGGYSYDDKPAAQPKRAVVRAVKRGGPVATLPGFEETNDGGSRLFVQLTQNVPVEERKAQGSLTYVLKGAHVNRWNNTNALVTVHFNTPVWRARLVPQGNDLLFVVDLRAAATPTWKITEAADHTAMLTVDFAKGDYSNVAAPTAEPAGAPQKKIGKARKGEPAPPPDQGGDVPAATDNGGTGPKP
jgi:hypothetical protein